MGASETVYHQLDTAMVTEFSGYDGKPVTDAKVIALVANNAVADSASAGDEDPYFLTEHPSMQKAADRSATTVLSKQKWALLK